MICKLMKHKWLLGNFFINHLANCGEPLSEPFRDCYFKKVSRIVASVSQTFLCNIPYVQIIHMYVRMYIMHAYVRTYVHTSRKLAHAYVRIC